MSVITDYGYASETLVWRLYNLLSGSNRLVTEIGTVNTEFTNFYTSSYSVLAGATAPTNVEFKMWPYDGAPLTAQTPTVYISASGTRRTAIWNERGTAKVDGLITVAMASQHIEQAHAWARRIQTAIIRLLVKPANAGFQASGTDDGKAGVIGIEEIETRHISDGLTYIVMIGLKGVLIQEDSN